MARLFTTGWETGSQTEIGLIVGSPGTIETASPVPRVNGAYCWKSAQVYDSAQSYVRFDLTSPLTELWLRVGFYPIMPGNWATSWNCIWLMDPQGGVQISVGYDQAGSTQFYLMAGGPGNAVLGSSSTPGGYITDRWHLLELHWQALTGATGLTELYINGARAIYLPTSDNTATAFGNVQYVAIGAWHQPGVAYGQGAFDDFALNDTTGSVNNGRIGDGRVILLRPNAAGDTTLLGRGGTDTGANYSQVSEVPFSMAQYVTSATPTDRDLYRLTDPPANTTNVNVVEVIAQAQLNDTGPGSLGLTVKSSSAIAEAAPQALSSGLGIYRARWEVDPNTGSTWLPLAVNNLQAGVTIR